MHILPIPSVEDNQAATALRDAATHLMHAATPGVHAPAQAAHAMLDGLHGANLPFCAYAAVALGLGVKSYLARKERKLEHARDDALHSWTSLILAVVHLLS
jgi:hypothetical protein